MEVCEKVIDHLCGISGVEHVWIVFWDAASGCLLRVAGSGYYSEHYPGGPIRIKCTPEEGVTGLAFRTRKLQVINNYSTWEGRFRELPGTTTGYAIACPIILPEAGESDPPHGVLACCGPESPSPVGLDVYITQYAQILALAIHNLNLKKQMLQKERLYQERIQVAARMEAVSTFAATFVHDIRNALQAVIGHAELLCIKSDDAIAQDYAENIIQVSRTTSRMANRLLASMRRDNEGQTGQGKSCVVSEVMPGIIELVRPLAARVGMFEVKIEPYPDQGVILPIGETDLLQIVSNLVINAADASSPGKDSLISLRAWCCEHNQNGFTAEHCGEKWTVSRSVYEGLANGQRAFVIEVTDNGCGIDWAIARRIFDPLYTTKKHGTGLGLSSIYHIVRQANGGLSFWSMPGKTIFRVCLPIKERAQESDVVCYRAQGRVIPPIRKKKVVVIEDDEMQRDLLGEGLSTHGYEVVVFSDPLLALKDWEEKKPDWDIVVSDFMMPGMDGLELLRRIGESARRVPKRILASGHVGPAFLMDAAGDGILILPKPFSLEELLSLIQRTSQGTAFSAQGNVANKHSSCHVSI